MLQQRCNDLVNDTAIKNLLFPPTYHSKDHTRLDPLPMYCFQNKVPQSSYQGY